MPNIALMQKALDAIAKYPEFHYQGQWSAGNGQEFKAAIDNGDHPEVCGTTLCMAGWVSFQNAPKGTTFRAGSSAVYLPDGNTSSMWKFAQSVLDLGDEQSEALFIHANDLDDLKEMVAHLEENPGADMIDLRIATGELHGDAVAWAEQDEEDANSDEGLDDDETDDPDA